VSVTSDNGIAIVRGARNDDGAGMWRVVEDCGVLDRNSSYLYLLLARDFAANCVVAEMAGETVGFVTGFRRPSRPDAVFLWQVGILPQAQGQGLGKRLVAAFLRQPGARDARWLETTITPSNEASRGLFRAIARDLGTDCKVSPCFTPDLFPESGHEPEELFEIGPFDPKRVDQLTY
jgi:L-2,4-diaminobutyric acid acetyltransferase